MRIFLTGASGFIGTHLLPLLDGHEVLCLSRRAAPTPASGPRSLVGDLSQPGSYSDAVNRFQPECCIHLAWEGLPDYSLGKCRANLAASINLFDILARSGCRKIVAVGTCWEYGNLAGAVAESDIGTELGLFAAFKAAVSTIGRGIGLADGGAFVWGRIFFAYGPGQRATSLIPSCYRSLREGAVPSVKNPLAVNDFIHVADVAAALRTVVEAGDAGGTYNIGAGRPVAVWEVVNLIAAHIGVDPAYREMPAAAGGFWADTAKLRRHGWQPELSLQAGIARTLDALEAAR